ncbi:hypothetical protein RVU96_06545 [Bordetella avium]|uniref:hypothetical protein n=1 Tax=Bordetella avium TaxID=521 RepID=UPI00273DB8F5|nr:hypothetical protein [Bordetella avium]WQE35274.1 hypothetical protein U0029_08960 [Bordetella avium]
MQDAWWPFGNGDMLQRAMLVAYRSGFYTDEALRVALEMATEDGAQVLGLQGYGLRPGNVANFVVLPAPNGTAAWRRRLRRARWCAMGVCGASSLTGHRHNTLMARNGPAGFTSVWPELFQSP